MTPLICKICDIGEGSLYAMPKPSSDCLEDDLNYFKSLGVTKIVSLLEKDELQSLRLDQSNELCEKLGLDYESMPIKDRTTPNPHKLKRKALKWLNELENGAVIAIHCRGGIGRTGIVTSAILIELGYAADAAMVKVSDARQCTIPDTHEQHDFILEYESLSE